MPQVDLLTVASARLGRTDGGSRHHRRIRLARGSHRQVLGTGYSLDTRDREPGPIRRRGCVGRSTGDGQGSGGEDTAVEESGDTPDQEFATFGKPGLVHAR